jgi:hypothetical protein
MGSGLHSDTLSSLGDHGKTTSPSPRALASRHAAGRSGAEHHARSTGLTPRHLHRLPPHGARGTRGTAAAPQHVCSSALRHLPNAALGCFPAPDVSPPLNADVWATPTVVAWTRVTPCCDRASSSSTPASSSPMRQAETAVCTSSQVAPLAPSAKRPTQRTAARPTSGRRRMRRWAKVPRRPLSAGRRRRRRHAGRTPRR